MTSWDNLNETTKNLLIALENYKVEQPKPIVIKLIYDKDTGLIEGITTEETNKPWLPVTKEEYNAGIPYKALKVINGKLIPMPKIHFKLLPLIKGNRWFTTKENMLIIGNENGWDERGNN
jgi:hypothetical protein